MEIDLINLIELIKKMSCFDNCLDQIRLDCVRVEFFFFFLIKEGR